MLNNNNNFQASVNQQSDVQFSDEVLINTSRQGKAVPDEVVDFLNQYHPPQLVTIDVKQTPGFLEKFIKPRLRYNLLSQDVELDGASLRRHESENLKVEDRIEVIFREECQAIFEKPKPFKNYLYNIIGENHYHPVEKYLESLQQSSISPVNIDNLAERYLGNKNSLSNLLLKKTLIAAVARVFQPGCDVHSILVLYSPKQGIGKSRFLRTLTKNSEWFNDTMPKISPTSDFYAKLHRFWITEIGEIDTKFNRNKEEEIKDFITSTSDSFRPAYSPQRLNCRRRFILTGTTNNGNFLKDPTGSRRYWIVPVKGKIDIPSLENEIDGIWASAVEAYLSDEPWWLTDEEAELVEQFNASYSYEHPWHQPIKSYLDEHQDDEYILPQNIAAIPSLGIPMKELNKPNSKSLKEIRDLLQQKFGYSSKKISNHKRQKLFDELKNDSSLRPQVSNIRDIPYSIWVKFEKLFKEDSV